MAHKLPKELADALNTNGDGPLEVVDSANNRTYFVVDGETHRQAMEALRRQQDREAIAEGIAQMKTGDVVSLEEARRQTRQDLLTLDPER
jgi:hypothetical protein